MKSDECRTHFRRALTVAELIDELEQLEPAAMVVFETCYGDITNTRQLLAVQVAEQFDPASEYIYSTTYSNSGVAVRDREEEGDEDEGGQEDLAVVILR
jgi:hypothetical protein